MYANVIVLVINLLIMDFTFCEETTEAPYSYYYGGRGGYDYGGRGGYEYGGRGGYDYGGRGGYDYGGRGGYEYGAGVIDPRGRGTELDAGENLGGYDGSYSYYNYYYNERSSDDDSGSRLDRTNLLDADDVTSGPNVVGVTVENTTEVTLDVTGTDFYIDVTLSAMTLHCPSFVSFFLCSLILPHFLCGVLSMP